MISQSTGAPRPIGQTTITKQTIGGVRIQGPIVSTGPGGPRLMNSQIRSMGPTMIDTNNLQTPPALQPVNRNPVYQPATHVS